ncbi:hypothetical protein Tco_0301028 [Tanacetum coccineum]
MVEKCRSHDVLDEVGKLKSLGSETNSRVPLRNHPNQAKDARRSFALERGRTFWKMGEVKPQLHFVEDPVEIVGREVKRLKRSRIPLVKVRWNSKRSPEFTWEREDQFKKKYPHLFTKTAPSSSAAS